MIVDAETAGKWTLSVDGMKAEKVKVGGDEGSASWAKARIHIKKNKHCQVKTIPCKIVV